MATTSYRLPPPQKPPTPRMPSPNRSAAWKPNSSLYRTPSQIARMGKSRRLPARGAPGAAGTPGSGPGASAPALGSGTRSGPNLYLEYQKTAPWAIPALQQLDADQAAHQAYVTGQVMPALSGGLAAITGVDPSHPGYNPTVQQQYLANIIGQVGGSLSAAAGATPMNPQSASPGGIVSAPNAYQGAAMREASAQRGGAAINAAQAQSVLNTLGPNTFAQNAVMRLADYAKGLPDVYVTKRADLRSKIDQFVQTSQANAAKEAEVMRHNRVTESLGAQNAMTNAAYQFGNLGVSSDKLAQSQQQLQAAAQTPAPYGYNRDPASGRLVRDPSIPAASSATGATGGRKPTSTRDAQGRLLQPSEHGFTVGGWAKRPTGLKIPVAQGADGRWWAKPGSAAAGPKPKAGTDPETVLTRLNDKILNGGVADDQPTGTADLLRFLRPMQPTPGTPAWVKWFDDTLGALRRAGDQNQVGDRYVQWVSGWVKRRKADAAKTGKPYKAHL